MWWFPVKIKTNYGKSLEYCCAVIHYLITWTSDFFSNICFASPSICDRGSPVVSAPLCPSWEQGEKDVKDHSDFHDAYSMHRPGVTKQQTNFNTRTLNIQPQSTKTVCVTVVTVNSDESILPRSGSIKVIPFNCIVNPFCAQLFASLACVRMRVHLELGRFSLKMNCSE